MDDSSTPLVPAGLSYSPFGVPQSGAQPQPFGFTGELHHGGLQYLRARWYDPGEGTFTSKDPFAGYPTRPYSLHPYQYGYSAPTMWTDPSGESPQTPSTLEGLYVQVVIQMHFLATFPPPNGAAEFWVPKGSTRSPGIGSGFVDMVRRQQGYIYEIKHQNARDSLVAARYALGVYEKYLNSPCDGRPLARSLPNPNMRWQRGLFYSLPSNYGLWPIGLSTYNPQIDGWWIIKARYMEPGVIFYWAEKLSDNDDPRRFVYAPESVQEAVEDIYRGRSRWRRPDFGRLQPMPPIPVTNSSYSGSGSMTINIPPEAGIGIGSAAAAAAAASLLGGGGNWRLVK